MVKKTLQRGAVMPPRQPVQTPEQVTAAKQKTAAIKGIIRPTTPITPSPKMPMVGSLNAKQKYNIQLMKKKKQTMSSSDGLLYTK